jgi:hypothetical protein
MCCAQVYMDNVCPGPSPSESSRHTVCAADECVLFCRRPSSGFGTELQLGFDAVAAIASPDELSAIVEALYEDKDPNVLQYAHRIHAMRQGEPPGDVAEHGNGVGDEQK